DNKLAKTLARKLRDVEVAEFELEIAARLHLWAGHAEPCDRKGREKIERLLTSVVGRVRLKWPPLPSHGRLDRRPRLRHVAARHEPVEERCEAVPRLARPDVIQGKISERDFGIGCRHLDSLERGAVEDPMPGKVAGAAAVVLGLIKHMSYCGRINRARIDPRHEDIRRAAAR